MSIPTLISSLMCGDNFKAFMKGDYERAFALMQVVDAKLVDTAVVRHLTSVVNGSTQLDTLLGSESQDPTRTAQEIFDAILKTASRNLYKGGKGTKRKTAGSDDEDESSTPETQQSRGERRCYVPEGELPNHPSIKFEQDPYNWGLIQDVVESTEFKKVFTSASKKAAAMVKACHPSKEYAIQQSESYKWVGIAAEKETELKALLKQAEVTKDEIRKAQDLANKAGEVADELLPSEDDVELAQDSAWMAQQELDLVSQGETLEGVTKKAMMALNAMETAVYTPAAAALLKNWKQAFDKFNVHADGGPGSPFAIRMWMTEDGLQFKVVKASVGNNNIVDPTKMTIRTLKDIIAKLTTKETKRVAKGSVEESPGGGGASSQQWAGTHTKLGGADSSSDSD